MNEIQLTKRIPICDLMLKLLKSKADIHQKKVMLSVWWDFKGIAYFELLPRNQTINSNVYCRQLMKLDKETKEKRPKLATRKGVIFHQDNARPLTSLLTRKKLLELGWEVMSHPPHNPDITPSDYHYSFIPYISKPFESKNIRFKWGCQKWVDSVFCL